MRRLTVLALALAALGALPGHAAPAPPALTDPKGDWSVAGQDFTAVRISSVLAAGKRAVRAEVELVSAPELPTTYVVSLGRAGACEWWSLVGYDFGAPNATARLERHSCSADPVGMVTGAPDATAPATVELRGTTIVLTAPYSIGLGRGARVHGVSAVATTRMVGVVYADSNGAYEEFYSGDVGYGDFRWLVP